MGLEPAAIDGEKFGSRNDNDGLRLGDASNTDHDLPRRHSKDCAGERWRGRFDVAAIRNRQDTLRRRRRARKS